ncbi:hypothetical protein CNBA1860 [Cryptococcus deneoformans B-3501A]|uniref:hypothetical protein n=1 Tax=Cryptococcus deneoformans (strain B-3501A) TaxID=283643 RepID=UPI000042CFB4|nr:hypothetical protein CNBA1860 [Cryptococcus neoformans var. neoformans B-3501A]EAL23539.1 hypothetical protein CNBA1860 [Cryptococcus neoformans var. neoformans B-3501A]
MNNIRQDSGPSPTPESSFGSPRRRASSPRPHRPSADGLLFNNERQVPPPIYLRNSSPRGLSSRGEVKIHIPAWGIAFVRPPRPLEVHPLETTPNHPIRPPSKDTVLSGGLEIIMKERRRVKAISVGVQSVCRLYMGQSRGWEEDGIFERGVEVLSGDEEGIWLEKGSQSFSFSILLPGTLATTDSHTFGRVSYIITARVEGIESSTSSFSSIFKFKTLSNSFPSSTSGIPNIADFERVIARSNKFAADVALGRARSASMSRSGTSDRVSTPEPGIDRSSIDDQAVNDVIDSGSPPFDGLYTRRHSSDLSPVSTPLSLSSSLPDTSFRPNRNGSTQTEKDGWLEGDLKGSRELSIYAVSPSTGGVCQLDVRKEGSVDGLGSWKFNAAAEVFSVSSVILLSISIPAPSAKTTIFLARLVLTQSYTITSPRTPNVPPSSPESQQKFVLYQVGRQHKQGEVAPGRSADALWRGIEAAGAGGEEGWKIKAVARIPGHDKIRPTTYDGTITPIKVSHELTLQLYYSMDGLSVTGQCVEGPGALRLMQVRIPIFLPSCHCVSDALHLPTYNRSNTSPWETIDEFMASQPDDRACMCGWTFAELGEAALRKMRMTERDEAEEHLRQLATEGNKGRREDYDNGDAVI